jgi:small subunit ribosomal protein S10
MINLVKQEIKVDNFRIKLWSYDLEALKQACEQIKKIEVNEPGFIKGPIPLPKRIRRWCLLKSPHVNKKSREHFEATTYSRIIDVYIEVAQVDKYGEDLCKIGFPSGVRMELRNSVT